MVTAAGGSGKRGLRLGGPVAAGGRDVSHEHRRCVHAFGFGGAWSLRCVAAAFRGPPDSLGGSVMRFLVYRNLPNRRASAWGSSPHADMGLVTVAAPSSSPALSLFRPLDGHRVHPESELQSPREWVVFAGETMSYLTNGALPAPIHGVQDPCNIDTVVTFEDRQQLPRRCSAPFFLRAAPDAELRALHSGGLSISCRDLMEQHSIGPRPWRLRGTTSDF